MTLGQRIQEYRLRLELSQEALGERLGVSRQAVSKWEADAAVPDTLGSPSMSCSRLRGRRGLLHPDRRWGADPMRVGGALGQDEARVKTEPGGC